MKNPFKKNNILATVKDVAFGGAGNVAYDYLYSKIDAAAGLGDVTKNAIKIGVGAVGGAMVKQSWAKSMLNGVATVGVSNLISHYMPGGEGSVTETTVTAGLPKGTIGRIRLGQRGFRRGRVAGVAGADFMGA